MLGSPALDMAPILLGIYSHPKARGKVTHETASEESNLKQPTHFIDEITIWSYKLKIKMITLMIWLQTD